MTRGSWLKQLQSLAGQPGPLDDHSLEQCDYAMRKLGMRGRLNVDDTDRVAESAKLLIATHLEEVINFAEVKF